MIFKKKSVKYLGHMITADGLKADPEKVRAIQEMKPPTNVTELKGFLGLINYLAKFYKHLSEDTATLRQLDKKDVEWHWE